MVAGTVSTVLFAMANLPMVIKALRSRDLRSYSASALVLGNAGNVVHTVYVLSLPFGPIWVLHGFYLVTMAIMLILFAVSAHTSPPEGVPQPSSRRFARRAAVPFRHGGHHRRAREGASGISVR